MVTKLMIGQLIPGGEGPVGSSW